MPDASNLPDLNSGKAYPFKKVGGEPEDIFGDTEKLGGGRVEKPANPINPLSAPAPLASNFGVQTMPAQNRPVAAPAYTPGLVSKSGGNKILTILVIILAVVAAGLLGWWAYGKYFAEKAAPADNSLENTLQNLNNNLPNLNQNNEVVTPPAEEPVVAPPTEEQVVPTTTANSTLDSDGDGLTDAEEAQLGTNPNRVDSDFDGLSDYDEVKIWQTNPLNPDTDGDGYFDGQEVQNGYNPLGPGKMTPEQLQLKNGQ